MSNAFRETRNLFINYTNYTRPLSYVEWVATPEDHKAAVLYVQFYEQITLAYYKTKSFFVVEEDAVSTILQYLVKNVPIIKNEPKRFKESYIYQVAYNCLYCISHDIKRDIERWENETSNIIGYGEDELDLFDTVLSNCCDADEELTRQKFWAIIEQMGPETEKVVNHLLNGTSMKKAMFRAADPSTRPSWDKKTDKEKSDAMFIYKCTKNNYEIDPLKDISVSAKQAEEIIANLREKLDAYRSVFM